MIRKFPTIFTPQGDGNNFLLAIFKGFYHEYSRQYLPRKGTETVEYAEEDEEVFETFPTIFTPQGDGNLPL